MNLQMNTKQNGEIWWSSASVFADSQHVMKKKKKKKIQVTMLSYIENL